MLYCSIYQPFNSVFASVNHSLFKITLIPFLTRCTFSSHALDLFSLPCQVPLLEQGLMVHADRVSAQIIDLHNHMLKQFDKMKRLLTSKYGELPRSDLTIKRRSLRPMRQTSIDGATGTRSSHYAGSNESVGQPLQRLSVGGGYSTLQRNKLSTTSLPLQSKNKFRSLLRRESYTSKEGQSLFYDNPALQPSQQQQQPIIEISETLVTERPARCEADERRYSRPTSQVSITTTTTSSTPTNSGSSERLGIPELGE